MGEIAWNHPIRAPISRVQTLNHLVVLPCKVLLFVLTLTSNFITTTSNNLILVLFYIITFPCLFFFSVTFTKPKYLFLNLYYYKFIEAH